jgi:predicted HicB family RNase H-like nuclease
MIDRRVDYEKRRMEFTHFSLRIPHDDIKQLREKAAKSGTSVNSLILEYITWGLENG